jgi:hypothetical protein
MQLLIKHESDEIIEKITLKLLKISTLIHILIRRLFFNRGGFKDISVFLYRFISWHC